MRFLLLNQTFHPDVASTAQHLKDLALGLFERGHEVAVITSRRAYDNPAIEFPAHEIWHGIEIHRVGSTRFGKGAKWRRAADFASFIATSCLRLLRMRRPDVVIALTSPPLISFIGAWYARLRGARFCYWVMDLNPDEAIAAGWLRRESAAGRVLEWMSRFSFRHASRVIALDRFMHDRIAAKLARPVSRLATRDSDGEPPPSSAALGVCSCKAGEDAGAPVHEADTQRQIVRRQSDRSVPSSRLVTLPPWSHDDHVRFDAVGRERFRAAHGLSDKFVVMYSGNHSPCHPLDTILAAAKQMVDSARPPSPPRPGRGNEGEVSMNSGKDAFHCVPDRPAENGDAVERVPAWRASPIVFCFIGGGSEFKRVQAFAAEHRLHNILCLPYQPLDQLSASLSAADAHLVVMGDPFVGIVHPCKIYNILAVGAPVLYVGPQPSHLTEILAGLGDTGLAASVRHGATDELLSALQRIRSSPAKRFPPHIPEQTLQQFGRDALLGRMIEVLETPGG